MSVHLTEEEQLENMKRWWKEYGKLVIFAAIIAIAGYFGVTGWQDHQRQKAEQASATYEQMLKLIQANPGEALSKTDRASVEQLATELKTNNSDTIYAQTAAFFLAKLALEDNKLDEAASELKWVLSAKPDAATAQIAHLRLARVLTAQKAYDQALEQLAQQPAAAFASEYDEARGDILKLQGNLDAARTAYTKALAATDSQQQERYMLLQMKVDDLKTPDTASAGEAAAVSSAAAAPASEETAQ